MDTTNVREIVKTLEQPVSSIDTLLELLIPPLHALQLVPRGFRTPDRADTPLDADAVLHALPELQRVVLFHVVPVWLSEGPDARLLLEQYFVPVSVPARSHAERVALHALSTLLATQPMGEWALEMLDKLCRTYSLVDLHWAAFSDTVGRTGSLAWETVVRLVPSIPSRVANARKEGEIPRALRHAPYMARLCSEFYDLANSASRSDADIASLSTLLHKLVNQGLFPTGTPNQPSFFATILAQRLGHPAPLWPTLLASLPAMTLPKVLASLLSSLQLPAEALDCSPASSALVKQQARLFVAFAGTDPDVMSALIDVALDREWTEPHARVVCAALCLCGEAQVAQLLDRASETWTNAQFVKHSLLQRHRYMTLLLLLALSNFPPRSPQVLEVSISSTFLSAVSAYIGHLDPAVRRCGMLVAEEVAAKTGRALKFDVWDGVGDGREWARDVRRLLESSDVDAPDEVAVPAADAELPSSDPADKNDDDGADAHVPDSDDDSLVGYDSDDTSRSASPTPSELAAIRAEPSLAAARPRRPRRPVYLLDLAHMLQHTPKPEEAADHAERIEVALECAEELVRRKEGYGFELEENAVNLAWALVGLQDNYDLPKFHENRQRALTALVACCPTKGAPAVIELYFNDQFSIQQRFAILNALAFGARELAGLSIPESMAPQPAAFPSRMLPAAQHVKYTAQESETQRIQNLLGGITRAALERTRDSHPEPQSIVRERRLRVGASKASAGVVEFASRTRPAAATPTRTRTPFAALAAECFLMPLMNRFWVYAGDAEARRLRRAQRQPGGSGVLLGALVLSQFLATLGVLVHAARHAPAFLAVLAPEALELALDTGLGAGGEEGEDGGASVLTGALELALLVLDACADLDGGRSLALERAPLVLGVQEWADEVFKGLEMGLRVKGGGGALEVRLKTAAAGVGMKLSEITDRWGRSMITLDM